MLRAFAHSPPTSAGSLLSSPLSLLSSHRPRRPRVPHPSHPAPSDPWPPRTPTPRQRPTRPSPACCPTTPAGHPPSPSQSPPSLSSLQRARHQRWVRAFCQFGFDAVIAVRVGFCMRCEVRTRSGGFRLSPPVHTSSVFGVQSEMHLPHCLLRASIPPPPERKPAFTTAVRDLARATLDRLDSTRRDETQRDGP